MARGDVDLDVVIRRQPSTLAPFCLLVVCWPKVDEDRSPSLLSFLFLRVRGQTWPK